MSNKSAALDTFDKMIFHFHEQFNYKREIAKRLKEKGISDEIIKECLI
ncbi:hypothetical protein HMPREF9145_1123 [Segatella salivae F0493]|uniref:Uncharacterized protein n=1 Tax=Segatella salivae F0493 TaxID=1395125 RepID=U2L1M5_9BACT|nr:hypothetical protein HMPREF9145_1123 [Segatella salivae F0493]